MDFFIEENIHSNDHLEQPSSSAIPETEFEPKTKLFSLDDPATWNVKNDDEVQKVVQSNLKQDLHVDFSKSERVYKNDLKKTVNFQ